MRFPGITPGSEDPRGQALAGWLQALPDFALALACLAAWIAPARVEPGLVRSMLMIMLLEFIIIHSSAFMGTVVLSKATRGARARAIALLGLFYSLFVAGFALAFRTAWPVVTFWGLSLNRLLGVLLGQAPAGEELLLVRRGWAAHAMFYLLAVFLTTPFPVPRLGLTDDVLPTLGLTGGGLWVEHPQHLLAAGVVYFAAVGLSGAHGHRWLRERDLGDLRERGDRAA